MNLPEFCPHIFPFKDISPVRFSEYLVNIHPDVRVFTRGQTVFDPRADIQKIGFVVSGECEVVRVTHDGAEYPMNLLRPYDSFGVLSLFSERVALPSIVRTRKKSEILFIKRSDVMYLIRESREIALNFITFLSGRVVFLSEKVATLSCDSAEEKVASYLFVEYKKVGNVSFTFNCKQASEKLRLSRASIYRALDALSERGIVHYEDKQITIISLKGLERKTS